jgi:HEPN domain-containing protein
MTKDEIVKYWIEASEFDLRAMQNLFNSKDYVWCLFLGHLVIEKLIKAIAVKNDLSVVPKIHDLNKLANAAGLVVDSELADLLDVITAFNIEARYPDYKKEFYKKANNDFALYYKNKITELRIWLIDQLNK